MTSPAEEVAVPELPPRPQPPRSVRAQARAWIGWFGLTRLLVATVAIVVVAGGVWLLLRTPPPAAEATLPVTSGSPPQSTLPVAAPGAPDVSPVVVHVAGAVATPGVYEVLASGRVIDAIAAAGGAVADAELDALNLAAPVTDGQRIYVPVAGEVVTPAPDEGSDTGAPPGPVDINSASAGQLEELPGVGPATAAAIIRHREEHGPFAAVDDLADVRGIGPVKLDSIRDLVRV